MSNITYYVRRHKHLRRFCRLLLNFAILSLLGFLIWFGVLLFSGQWGHSPITGGLIFVAALASFIWLSKVGLTNDWQPSMKVTVLSLVTLFFIFAFAGVQPLANYKDIFINQISTHFINYKPISGNEDTVVTNPIVTTTYEELFTQFRQTNGLSPLIFTDDLNRIAGLRVAEIKTNFSHYSEGGYNLHLGENIAMQTFSLSDSGALTLWEESSGHRANMLDSSYVYTGYANKYGYAVQLFSQFETIDGIPQLPPGWYWDE